MTTAQADLADTIMDATAIGQVDDPETLTAFDEALTHAELVSGLILDDFSTRAEALTATNQAAGLLAEVFDAKSALLTAQADLADSHAAHLTAMAATEAQAALEAAQAELDTATEAGHSALDGSADRTLDDEARATLADHLGQDLPTSTNDDE
ncbi:MAG: hypothetical protein FWG11_07585 [Promicromonosporaceae bacterium]|nr:hypothetical protein [Promicromonosporaceae bacterium]